MVFLGEYEVSFTAPGRVVLPKKLRELLKGSTFVLSRGFDVCLSGYDKQDFENRSTEFLQVSLLEKENLEKRRFMFSSAVYLEIDEQGRFIIPRILMQYAGLAGKVIIVGVGDHFELWNTDTWKEYLRKNKS